jgi:hypothetical protein
MGAFLALVSGILQHQERRDLGRLCYYSGVLCFQFAQLGFYVLVVILLARFALSP